MTNFRRAVLAIIIAVFGTVGLSAGLASAHSNAVSGTSVCQSNGTYTITWKITNDYPSIEDVTLVTNSGGGTLAGLPGAIASGNGSFINVTQTGVPGTATAAGLTVHSDWRSDHFTLNNSGSVTLAGTCKQHNTPAAPTYTPPTCFAAGTVVAPDTAAVHWTFAGTTSVTATATAKAGYVLDGQTVYGPYAVGQLTGQVCLVISTPVAPTVTTSAVCATLDTYTAGPTVGVLYNGQASVTGSLTAGQVVVITATPAAGYKFATEQQSKPYTVTGGAVEVCETTTVPTTTPPTTVPPTTVPTPCVYDTSLPADSPLCVPPTIPTTVPPTAPPTTVVPPVLPATGKSHGGELMFASILVVAGMLATAATRRRKNA